MRTVSTARRTIHPVAHLAGSRKGILESPCSLRHFELLGMNLRNSNQGESVFAATKTHSQSGPDRTSSQLGTPARAVGTPLADNGDTLSLCLAMRLLESCRNQLLTLLMGTPGTPFLHSLNSCAQKIWLSSPPQNKSIRTHQGIENRCPKCPHFRPFHFHAGLPPSGSVSGVGGKCPTGVPNLSPG